MIPERNDTIGRQNFSTRSMTQKDTFGTSGTVSATAEPTVKVQLPICGNAKCECKCKARSVDSSPSTRVRRAQDALRAQMMVGKCARNPTKKVVSKNDSNNFILLNNLCGCFHNRNDPR